MNSPITHGANASDVSGALNEIMSGADATRVINYGLSVLEKIPDPQEVGATCQGLLLGMVQSGKTSVVCATIGLATDNRYRLFIIFTTDNLWLYDQTFARLRSQLSRLVFFGKDEEIDVRKIAKYLNRASRSVVLIVTKNARHLSNLVNALRELKGGLNDNLPATIIIDDEADQGSLDTNTSKRAKDSDIDPSKIYRLISDVRTELATYAYLQVTATPQALFVLHP